jgi:hypothetical protein
MTPCLLWKGARSRNGYGNRMIYRRDHRPRRQWIGAHRLAYEQHIGPIPNGMCVLHRCDVKLCVNPDHLFLGSRRDNAQDMAVKGRCPDVRLTVKQVRAIRRRCEEGDAFTHIADDFGVTDVTVRNIDVRRTWAWLR